MKSRLASNIGQMCHDSIKSPKCTKKGSGIRTDQKQQLDYITCRRLRGRIRLIHLLQLVICLIWLADAVTGFVHKWTNPTVGMKTAFPKRGQFSGKQDSQNLKRCTSISSSALLAGPPNSFFDALGQEVNNLLQGDSLLESIESDVLKKRDEITIGKEKYGVNHWIDQLENSQESEEDSTFDQWLRSWRLPRALEIRFVLIREVIRPMLSSYFDLLHSRETQKEAQHNDHDTLDDIDWNAFWNQTSAYNTTTTSTTISPVNMTNADHVARALEELGPIYAKFGQLLAARPDLIPPVLADALLSLHDRMEPFDNKQARDVIQQELYNSMRIQQDKITNSSKIEDEIHLSPEWIDNFMNSLSAEPVAAASIGQVYKGVISKRATNHRSHFKKERNNAENTIQVAVKVKRPNIQETVDRDAELLRALAGWLEDLKLPGLPVLPMDDGTINELKFHQSKPLIATEITDVVEEFLARIMEEMDYQNEAINTHTFRQYYFQNESCPYDIIVPEVYPELCTDEILVTEWIHGEKLLSANDEGSNSTVSINDQQRVDNMELIQNGIKFTLWQLLHVGLVHGDPHLGNLLKVDSTSHSPLKSTPTTPILAYLDFGILTTVPQRVREATVCAVVNLVFNPNITNVANLVGESQMLNQHQFADRKQRKDFERALNDTYTKLILPSDDKSAQQEEIEGTDLPIIRLDDSLVALSKLVTQFEYTLPPYFFNSMRALITLEGIARRQDPNFNIMGVVYPWALDRLWANPNVSSCVEKNFRQMFYSPENDMLDISLFFDMITEMSKFTGRSSSRVFLDAMKARGVRRVFRHIWFDMAKATFLDFYKKIKFSSLVRSFHTKCSKIRRIIRKKSPSQN